MNTNKFLKLYDVFNNMGIKLTKIQISKLAELPDNVVNYIIKNGFYKHELQRILDCLNAEIYSIKEKDVLDFYKIYIKSDNHEYLLQLLEYAYIVTSDYFIDIVKVISKTKYPILLMPILKCGDLHIVKKTAILNLLSNIEKEENINNAVNVAISLSATFLPDFNLIDLVEIVAKAKNSYEAAEVATNKHVLASHNTIELVKIVAKAKKAKLIYEACIDETMLKCRDHVKLLELISKSDNEFLLYKIIKLVLPRNEVLQIAEIISKSNNLYTIENFLYMSHVYMYPEFMDLLNELATTKHPAEVLNVISNSEILQSGKALEVGQIVSNSKNFSAASIVATSTNLYNNENYVELVRLVGNSKNRTDIVDFIKCINEYPKSKQMEIANIVAFSKYDIYSGYIVFSADFKNNVEDGIKLLKILESSNIEVARFIYHSIVRNVTIKELLQLLEVIGNSFNNKNVDAIYQILTSGNYKKSKTPIDSVANIITSKNIYMKFEDAYELDPENAIKSLKEFNKEFPKSEFESDSIYVKTKLKSKRKNLR